MIVTDTGLNKLGDETLFRFAHNHVKAIVTKQIVFSLCHTKSSFKAGIILIFCSKQNIKKSSFKSSENIQKKEDGPDRSVSNNQFSSVTLNKRAIKARENILQSEPRCEKTGLRGFRPGPTQTRLHSDRRWLEA